MTRLFFEDAEVLVESVDAETRAPSDGGPHEGSAAASGAADNSQNQTAAFEAWDLMVSLTLQQHSAQVWVRGHLEGGDGRREAVHAKDVTHTADSATWRKRGKQAVLHVLHQLFEAETGEHQPWGILTGVRPLKLVHTMKEHGELEASIRRQMSSEYLVDKERTDLLMEIAANQERVVPDLYHLDKEISLYVGIPFCPTHCAYCTFPAYSMTEKATYVDAFLQAMGVEFIHLGRLLREYDVPVTSVYIGGGTPTSLRAGELQQLMEMLHEHVPHAERWRELTVEAGRPDTITPDRVKVMREYGVNRISVNPQTFKASTLKQIGRGHTPDIVDHRFHFVREAGFTNINMDMILGLPGEDLSDVRYTMERIERLNPDSVTVHTMSFKRTAVVNQERNRFEIPHTQLVRQMMAETSAWARDQHYQPYYVYRQKDILGNLENIGFARPGKESVYNVCIMEERQTIVGVGGGAATKLIGQGGKHLGRLANPREPKAYVETIEQVVAKKDDLLRATFEHNKASNKLQTTEDSKAQTPKIGVNQASAP